jgi:hypothetical protein
MKPGNAGGGKGP